MNDNMKLWKQVSKTDPAHTKKVTFGRKFTAIDAHYQVMKATETFGPVGQGWGYSVQHGAIVCDPQMVFATADVTIWWREEENGGFGEPNGFGPVRGAAELRWIDKNNNVKFDTDAPKKAMTDALTKGLSHLGFSADVFLGLFDDNKYVQEREAEEGKLARDMKWTEEVMKKLDTLGSTKEVEEAMAKLTPMLTERSSQAVEIIKEYYKRLKESKA